MVDHAKIGKIADAVDKLSSRMDALEHRHDALSTNARNELSSDQFAWPSARKLPIENAKHVKEAHDLLDDTDGMSAAEKSEAKRRIAAAAKRFNIDTSDWT